MFLTHEKAEVDVHDIISIKPDYTVDVKRTYKFTNTSDELVNISWEGLDLLPSIESKARLIRDDADIFGTPPEYPDRLLWRLMNKEITSGESIEITICFDGCNILKLDPLRIEVRYISRAVCRYSFEVSSPLATLFDNASIIIDDLSPSNRSGLKLVVGQDKRLHLNIPVLVSSNRIGPLYLQLTKQQASDIRITRLLQSDINAAKKNPSLLSDYVFLLIPHILRDSYSYFEALMASGVNPSRTFVIGIPYSTKATVVAKLWEKGFTHIWSPIKYPFLNDVEAALSEALDLCAKEERKLIIIEDGGYAGPLLHTKFSENLRVCTGIVEQTRNGIWQYQEMNIEPRIPILNFAECSLKLTQESPLIGEAVVHNVQTLISNYLGYGLRNYNPLVGYGSTGREVANVLAKIVSNKVLVFDQKKEQRIEAEKNFITDDSLEKLLYDRSLIISCTGASDPPFKIKELAALRHNAIFANASSKRREIDYDELSSLASGSSPKHIIGMGTRYTLLNEKSFVLLADGYPVNFVGESAPDEDISFIPSLLYKCACYIAEQDGQLEPGFLDIPDELQKDVWKHYEALRP